MLSAGRDSVISPLYHKLLQFSGVSFPPRILVFLEGIYGACKGNLAATMRYTKVSLAKTLAVLPLSLGMAALSCNLDGSNIPAHTLLVLVF